MKILMVNKFLYPNGGSETYIFKIGEYFNNNGHQVEFFGMNTPENIVGNSVNSYTDNMDFHTSKLAKLMYPFKIIYSSQTRKRIRKVLDDFKPDVVHINNFNFQLTPSLILEIQKYKKDTKSNVKIIFTAHDYQLICPNHMMKNPNTGNNCEKCLGDKFLNCTKGKCIHSSTAKSLIGTIEGYFWKFKGTYNYIDKVICPSRFLAEKFSSKKEFKNKLIPLHNFIYADKFKSENKENYVLYFGRYSTEKGIHTLIKACKNLPYIDFVFAGSGELENELENVSNIKNVGFKNGDELKNLIANAKFSVYTSEWFENCPFSVMESQLLGTPVLGANIGGIPELIDVNKTGELFESSNVDDLTEKISNLYNNNQLINEYSENCKNINFDNIEQYCQKLLDIYTEEK